MNSTDHRSEVNQAHRVGIRIDPAVTDRNRLTTAFRLILGIPHLLLVGAPMAAIFSWGAQDAGGWTSGFGGGGVLGVVAAVCAIIAWFAILFTGRYPDGLQNLATFYLRWRVRAVAYMALLRDEYPPFGDDGYPVALRIEPPDGDRDRLTVAFRIILAIPHVIAIWFLGIAWGITTMIAWFAILFTGRYPAGLYSFGTGVFLWNTRVEAYLLLLHDDYPPFSLH
jgi:hypothetical protein